MSDDMATIKTNNEEIKKEHQLRWEKTTIKEDGRILTIAYPTNTNI